MAILKNITEKGKDFGLLFERDEYITDLSKTNPNLIGALRCSPQNFPQVCRALKRFSGQHNSKMIRHFVVSISPSDEKKLSDTELLKVAHDVSDFFKDCYVKYAIHTNTPHMHFHILVCNTRISDGKQISMSDSDLDRFKEHCSSILRKFGLEHIQKIDKTLDGDPLEINEDLFPQALTKEEQARIIYGEEYNDKPRTSYYGNTRYVPIYGSINIIIPPGTQGTLYQGKNGTPRLTFGPSIVYNSRAPQINTSDTCNAELPTYSSAAADNFAEWNDEEPEWLSSNYVKAAEDFIDPMAALTKIIEPPKTDAPLVDPIVVGSPLIDPFVIIKK